MTENKEYIVTLLKKWPHNSKYLGAEGKESLKILFKGLTVLDRDEKNLVWDVYYHKNNDVTFLSDVYGLDLETFQEKQNIILEKMAIPIQTQIEADAKRKRLEKQRRAEERKRIKVENETTKGYLNQLEHFDLEMETLSEKYKDFPYTTRNQLIEKGASELLNLKLKISDEIDQVPETLHRLILGYRYLMRKSWNEISSLMRMSEGHAMKLHAEALQSFKEIIEKEQINEPKRQENEPSFMDRELRARQERFNKRTESDKSDNERERYVRHFK